MLKGTLGFLLLPEFAIATPRLTGTTSQREDPSKWQGRSL